MKKAVFVTFTLVALCHVSANTQTRQIPAQKSLTATPVQAAPAPERQTLVSLEALPAAVKATLALPSLKAWTPTEAFLVKTADGKEFYAINVKKEDETGSIQIDKEGKPVN